MHSRIDNIFFFIDLILLKELNLEPKKSHSVKYNMIQLPTVLRLNNKNALCVKFLWRFHPMSYI